MVTPCDPGTVPFHSHAPTSPPIPTGPLNPTGLHLPLAAPGLQPLPRTDNIGSSQLSREEQEVMFSTLEAIFQRAEEAEGGVGVSELRPLSTDVDEEYRTSGGRNVDALRGVRNILDQMWWSESEFMTKAAEVLADGSRDPEWRIPYGEAGVLDFFLRVVATEGVEHNLMYHSLRLVGNSCADTETDANRARVVSQNYTLSIIKQLRDLNLAKIVVPVIYNVCVDYGMPPPSSWIRSLAESVREPAQQQAANNGLNNELINLLCDRRFLEAGGRNVVGYASRLIELIVSLPNGTNMSPENAVETLFGLTADPDTDLEDFLTLISSAVAHLSDVRFQRYMIAQRSLEKPLSILVESYSRFSQSDDLVPSISSLDISSLTPRPEVPEDEKLLSRMRFNLIESLSEISSIPEFAPTYPLDSPLIGSLRMWLTVPHTQLQVCACVMLGNLARSDDICWTMVHDFRIHEPLIAILEDGSDPQALHAVIGFLKNLALLAGNKAILGKARLLEVLSRLWALETIPHIQFAGVSLARQVISGSQENVARLLTPLSPDPDSPAHSRTYLTLLLSLHGKSDQLPTKIEIARAVTAICRTLNTSPPPTLNLDIEDLKLRLFRLHIDVGQPIAVMLGQTKWPLIRSEAWFTFALMARHPEGAAVVSHALHSSEVFKTLVETVTGMQFTLEALGGVDEEALFDSTILNEEPTQEEAMNQSDRQKKKESEEQMARIDRENAIVLVNELLKNNSGHLAPIHCQILQDILHNKSVAQGSYDEFMERAKASWEARPGPEHGCPLDKGGEGGGSYDTF
ncbi:hypothetical protein FGG08_005965 [Glutinoglossum americanum]|uniref:Uncharacterized protein n=1 Tax=Glutinoglossum americanum TaxID=1670608 RepID=A0A9P8KVH2_9PEZI|nr:hypothetical protein FGG08_005965 [Glutinoglossum americanum]